MADNPAAENAPPPPPPVGNAGQQNLRVDDPGLLDRIGAAIADPEEAPPAPERARDEPDDDGEDGARAEAPRLDDDEDDEAPESDKQSDAGKDDDTEVIELSSYDELADVLGVEAKDLYAVPVPITLADGTRADVSIGDLKDAWQSSDKIAKSKNEIDAARQAFEKERQEAATKIQQSVMEAAALTETAEKRLLEEMESVNWSALRSEDPSEWAAKRQEFGERQRQIQEAKQQVATRYQQTIQAQQAEMQAVHAERLQAESQALLAAIPEWKNEETAKAERSQLRSYLAESGFAEAEIDAAADHRLIVMARKAQMYDEQMRKVDAARKKVVKIGKKVLRPGAKPSKADAANDRLGSLRSRHHKTGSVDSAAALIEQLL